MNHVTEERIAEAFHGIDFNEYEQVLGASKELDDISGEEVIEWVSENMPNWHYTEVMSENGVLNIEEIFKAEFKLEDLIDLWFTTDDHWWFYNGGDQWINEFNEITGREITVDDITKNIDINFLIDTSGGHGPGLLHYFEFLMDNNGDGELFVSKVAPEIKKFPEREVDDLYELFVECVPQLAEKLAAARL